MIYVDINNKDSLVPSLREFQNLFNRKYAFENNTKDNSWISNPINLANAIRDTYKLIRYYFISIVIEWKALEDNLKARLKQLGGTKQELTEIFDVILQNINLDNILNEIYKQSAITESIERHDVLNLKLFNPLDNTLKSEVRVKLLEIIKTFEESVQEYNIPIKITDAVLLGSNASYNYTEDSDLDVHIIVDTLNMPKALLEVIYDLCRNKFNSKYNIEFYDIPVEIFVEPNAIHANSNGIYSIIFDKWIKKPTQEVIPNIDLNQVTEVFNKLEVDFKDLINKPNLTSSEIENFINKIYEYRKEGLKVSEYSFGNLIFKEFRNKGYLGKLKELKDIIKSKELSL